MKYVVKITNRSLSSTIFTLVHVFIIIYQFQNQFHSMNAFVFQVTSSESHGDTNQSRNMKHIDIPQDQLSLMIRLCLTDSNFPAFVEAVEKELTNLTSSE